MSEEALSKVGLTTDAWVKMWNEGFEHEVDYDGEQHHGHGDEQHGHGHDHHHHDHGDEEEYEGHGSGKVDRYLQKYLPKLIGEQPSASILVSLCGNTPDLVWLCEQGQAVVGIDVSETAVKEVFESAKDGAIPYSVVTEGDFKIYTATDGKNLKVYVGDFLAATPHKVGTFDVIWDSHGIISVPVVQHPAFAEVFCKLLKPGGKILLSTAYFNIADLHKFPSPCPMGIEEAKKLFPNDFDIELLDNPKLPSQQKEFGVPWVTNPIILLSHKK